MTEMTQTMMIDLILIPPAALFFMMDRNTGFNGTGPCDSGRKRVEGCRALSTFKPEMDMESQSLGL